jgi:peptidyl-prolyl cis-trans isomerase D
MKDAVPVQVKASHILIKVDKAADQATVDTAKAKADTIYNDLKNGADFADKAKNLSDDTGSRDNGGDLSFFARGDMVKAFEDAAFAAKTGDLLAPIRTDYGWHIIKITDRKGFVDQSFDDWLVTLRKNSFIKQLIRF